MGYKITEQTCRDRFISGICSGCGGEIEPLETVDNSGSPTFWAGCKKCNQFESGVSKDVFWIASEMVKNGHVAYHHMDSPVGKDELYQTYWKESQTRGTATVVRDILRLKSNYDEMANPL